MAKQLVYSEEARKKMLSGVEQIAKAVKVTLGPCGRLVMLDKKYGAPTITKDGVSVAKEVELKDPLKTWAHSLSAKFLQRQTMLQETEQQRQQFLPMPSFAKDSRQFQPE